MNHLKKGLLLILLIVSLLTSITTYSNTIPHSNDSDYSTALKTFLKNKSNEFHGNSFLFNVEKQGDTYKVHIQHNNKTEIKTIPKATVNDFFQNNINSSGQNILNIIDIGGKK